MGYFGDSCIAVPKVLAKAALRFCTRIDDALFVEPKRHKSEASPFLEYSGLNVSFRDDGGDVIASLTLPEEKIAKLVEPA